MPKNCDMTKLLTSTLPDYDQKQVVHAISSSAFSFLCLAMASVSGVDNQQKQAQEDEPARRSLGERP